MARFWQHFLLSCALLSVIQPVSAQSPQQWFITAPPTGTVYAVIDGKIAAFPGFVDAAQKPVITSTNPVPIDGPGKKGPHIWNYNHDMLNFDEISSLNSTKNGLSIWKYVHADGKVTRGPDPTAFAVDRMVGVVDQRVAP